LLTMKSILRLIHFIAIGTLLVGTTVAGAQTASPERAAPDTEHSRETSFSRSSRSPLVDEVRAATARFVDINVAVAEGWMRGTPCVSGPNSGAMGVHFLLPSRVGDGVLKPSEPEALIYEPLPNGAMRLVGVEFIVLAADWAAMHPEGGAPAVAGHLTNYVGAPNRYGLPAFHELHVWAWERNPNGSFADFNTRVSCNDQPTE
jgi:hypothetical protein